MTCLEVMTCDSVWFSVLTVAASADPVTSIVVEAAGYAKLRRNIVYDPTPTFTLWVNFWKPCASMVMS